MDVVGGGWAADLLAAASDVAASPAGVPDGFVGELRSYQSEALAWLGFLDKAGLGGCLALDMGLGKTPTMLAHLLSGAARGRRWSSRRPRSSATGLPKLPASHPGSASSCITVHRAGADEIATEVADADVVVTTYGTAVRDVEALAELKWARVVLDEAQAIKNPANDTSQQLRRIPTPACVALTGTPIENGLGDLWAILDFANPGLVGPRPQFIARMSSDGTATRVEAEDAIRALNGILVFRRTKAEPIIAAELPDQIDELDHCAMTPEQIGMYQALLDTLITGTALEGGEKPKQGQILAAITALKQICNHPSAYQRDDQPLAGRSGKLARLEEIVDAVWAAGERVLVFTHFAEWGLRLAEHLTDRMGTPVACYHGGLSRTARDAMVKEFQTGEGPGALVLSLKAGGTGLNLTAASHVVLYDRWWNPAVEDQARDRAWRIGQTRTVISHRLICPGTVDERVEEVVAGKRRIADLVLPKSSSLADLDSDQLRSRARHPSRCRAHRRPVGRREAVGEARGEGQVSPPRRRKAPERPTRAAPRAAARLLGRGTDRRGRARPHPSGRRPHRDAPLAQLATAPRSRDRRRALLRRGRREGRVPRSRTRRGVGAPRHGRLRRRRRKRLRTRVNSNWRELAALFAANSRQYTSRGFIPGNFEVNVSLFAPSVDNPRMPDCLGVALEGATRGDEAAISTLYRSLNPPLLRYLRHHVGRTAEDVAADVWLALAPQLAGFDGSVNDLRMLMFTVARRRTVDHYRQTGRRPSTVAFDEDFDRPASDDTEAVAVSRLTAQSAVAALVRNLPEDQAEIVLLRVLGDLDVEQVAEIVGKTPGAVRVAQHRALARLQRTWQQRVVTQ